MSLQNLEISQILRRQGGLIEFSGSVPPSTPLITEGTQRDAIVSNNFAKLKVTANTLRGTITLKRVENDSSDFNGVNIHYEDARATCATISTPGYIYSGDFAGCVFYLYKTAPGKITDVHAYQGTVTERVTRDYYFFKHTQINRISREYSPSDYFNRNRGALILRIPTLGELSSSERSLSILSVVGHTTAITYLLGVTGERKGLAVKRLIRTYRSDF